MTASRYAFVDTIPDSLFDAVVNHGHGALRVRAETIDRLRTALLDGQVPDHDALAWPEPGWRAQILDALAHSQVVEHCEGNPCVTDDVLRRILDATHAGQRRHDELLADWTLAARSHAQRTRTVALVGGTGAGDGTALIDATTFEQIRRDALVIAGEVVREEIERADRTWRERARDWAEVRAILDEIASACGADASGVARALHAVDWRHSARLRALLAGLPPMRELVAGLGRGIARERDDDDRVLEHTGGPVARPVHVDTSVRELGTVEICGVERSDELARMLASEAMLRLRPRTRMLWHARRAERSLLAYHADSVATTRIVSEQQFRDGGARSHARAERGPVIVILDTSGSMGGPREALAKALVMQVLFAAGLEQRAVHVYNFSGAGELAEHVLSLDHDGLARALAFLTVSFGGGTAIAEALRRAVVRVESEDWRQADLLIVTDGYLDDPLHRFDQATIEHLRSVRARNAFRVHVALVEPLAGEGHHPWWWEDGSPAPAYQGDPHWVIKAIADRIHELASWLARLPPAN